MIPLEAPTLVQLTYPSEKTSQRGEHQFRLTLGFGKGETQASSSSPGGSRGQHRPPNFQWPVQNLLETQFPSVSKPPRPTIKLIWGH